MAKTTSSEHLNELKMPLVFGVSGHRDLASDDVPHFEECLRVALHKFKQVYCSTPLVLLSPLAKGADQLVARVAGEARIGAQLFASLPMPERMYIKDFDTQESLDDFCKALHKRQWLIELPLLAPEAKVAMPGPERNMQYRAVGEFIVRHCQILVALWDGQLGQGVGGTAEVVKRQLEGIPVSRQTIEPPEGFPVWWIPAAHEGHARPTVRPDCPVKMYPKVFEENEKEAAAYFSRIFTRVDDFNRSVGYWKKQLDRGTSADNPGIEAISFDETLRPQEKVIMERYRMADELAIHYQKRTRNTQYAVHLLVFLAFFLFVLYAHGGKEPKSLIAAGVTLILALVTMVFNRLFKTDSNYQDFRAVAEGLRVAFFWEFAGIPKSVADYYLRNQRSELDWIRSGLRGWHLQRSADANSQTPAPNQAYRLQLLQTHWVNAQRDYFESAKKRNEEIADRNEIVVGLLLFGALLVGVMLLLTLHAEPKMVEHELIALDTLLAGGALWHHFNERMAYHQHSKQYGRMHGIFSYASSLIAGALEAGKTHNALHWVYELGKQALAENGDWVLLHRERPVEVPHP
jgi:hypothetical protein